MKKSCTGILLAAGQGTRFGSNKLLHPLADGTPMAVACARNLRRVLLHCIAVVNDRHSEVARLLAEAGMQVIANPRARDGMGTSIACGVAASPNAGGWLIALADMPCIPVSVIEAVTDRLAQGGDIVAPVCQGQRGHPVGFAAQHALALRSLQADRGARDIIAAHRDTLVLIETQDRGVLHDIDTPASPADI
ncbi:MAG: nucleotidyltransferase family protein [Halobacteria archaeon]|nr:nucleotidyltransferase family protein [Halobacteria archaeon]